MKLKRLCSRDVFGSVMNFIFLAGHVAAQNKNDIFQLVSEEQIRF